MTKWCLMSTMTPQGYLKFFSLAIFPYPDPEPQLSWSTDPSWKIYFGIAAFTAHLGYFFVPLSVESSHFLPGSNEYSYVS